MDKNYTAGTSEVGTAENLLSGRGAVDSSSNMSIPTLALLELPPDARKARKKRRARKTSETENFKEP